MSAVAGQYFRIASSHPCAVRITGPASPKSVRRRAVSASQLTTSACSTPSPRSPQPRNRRPCATPSGSRRAASSAPVGVEQRTHYALRRYGATGGVVDTLRRRSGRIPVCGSYLLDARAAGDEGQQKRAREESPHGRLAYAAERRRVECERSNVERRER